MAPSLGEFLQTAEGCELFFCQMTFSDVREEVQPRSFWRGVSLVVLAGEESGGQRVVRENAEAVAAAGRQDFGLDAAVEDVVRGLTTNEMGEAFGSGGPHGVDDLPARKVGAADVAHLAGGHHVVEGAQGLVYRRRPVRTVHLVKVDVVGL